MNQPRMDYMPIDRRWLVEPEPSDELDPTPVSIETAGSWDEMLSLRMLGQVVVLTEAEARRLRTWIARWLRE